AFLHVRAILKITRDDYAGDLCLHQHSLISRAGADFVQIERHIFSEHFRNENRSRWRLRSFTLAGRALKRPVRDKHGQDNKKQIRPLRKPVIASTAASHLNLRSLGSTAL